MAKILTFQNKQDGTSDQSFLTDETEKLSFRTAEDGAVSLDRITNTALPRMPDPKKDWSNQELADLFRVNRLLNGANVPVETLRGITDEGDPWFVFCHLNGDVFIHMARIDGFYVLDSPNVHRPLRGRDFNELIADFTSDALPAYPRAGESGETTARVVRLERGGKVRLHPSAMLAALIWTLFMASEELVMLAPEEQTSDADDLLDFSDLIAADFEFHAPDMETADTASLGTPEAMKALHDDAAPQNAADSQLLIREAMGQQGLAMHQNGFAMGLSTIAIAMGFMSEAVLMDNQRKVLDGLNAIGFAQYAADADAGPVLEQIAGEDSPALLEMLAEFLGLDLSLNTEVAEQATGKNDMLQQDILLATAEAVGDDTLLPPSKTAQPVVREDDVELAETPVASSEAETIDMETLAALAAAAQQGEDVLTMADLLGTQQMEEFQLGQTTVLASFDVTKTDAFSLSDYIFVDQRKTDHREFDDHAQAFIDFIQAKETEVGIVTIGNEIIMIDRGAFQQDGSEKYSFSWETYDGQIISMIGLKSEFQQFDLIA